jgi:hypothetical protein
MTDRIADKRELFLSCCHEFHAFVHLPAEFLNRSVSEREHAAGVRSVYRQLMCDEAGRALHELGGLLAPW